MSSIPPNWLGSIIQTQGAQERAGQARSTDEAKQSERGHFAEKLQDVIETGEGDGEVYEDAEGTGSQGSPFSEADEEEQLEDEARAEDDSAGGLDIEA